MKRFGREAEQSAYESHEKSAQEARVFKQQYSAEVDAFRERGRQEVSAWSLTKDKDRTIARHHEQEVQLQEVKINNLEGEAYSYSEHCKRLTSEFSDMNGIMNKLQRTCDSLAHSEVKYQTQEEKAHDHWERKCSELEAREQSAMRQRIEELNNEHKKTNVNLKNDAQVARDECALLTKAYRNLQENLDMMVARTYEAENAAQAAEIELANYGKRDSKKMSEESEKELASLRETIKSLQAELDNSIAAMNQAENDASLAEAALIEERSKNSTIEAQPDPPGAEIKSLRKMLKTLEADCIALQDELNEKEKMCHSRDRTIKYLEVELDNSRAEFDQWNYDWYSAQDYQDDEEQEWSHYGNTENSLVLKIRNTVLVESLPQTQ